LDTIYELRFTNVLDTDLSKALLYALITFATTKSW